MRTIYILRHAKAGKANKSILDDHERPLTKKGVDACKLLAKYVNENEIFPDMVICSTSKRTKRTAELVLKSIADKVPVHMTSKLYLASVTEIISLIRKQDDSIKKIMIVGHNPGLQELCLLLVKEGARDNIKKMKEHFPPGAMAIFEIDIKKWDEVKQRSSALKDLVLPKNLG